MKLSTAIIPLLVITSLWSCSDKALEINDLKYSSTSIHQFQSEKENVERVIIYKLENNFSQITARSVLVKDQKKLSSQELINAFIQHCGQDQNDLQLNLIKVEKLDDLSTFYLSYNGQSVSKDEQAIIEEALEMTLLRNLKTKNFSIILTEHAES